MKRFLALFLVLALVFSMCMVFVACEQPENPDDDNTGTTPPDDDGEKVEPFSVDLAGYVANIGNATALGISNATNTGTNPKARARASMMPIDAHKMGGKVLRDDTSTAGKNSQDKNYIVMSTTNYDANTPEVDENGLTKVTFTKIVTENATTEITGTKLVTAKHGKVSINATHGFTYSLYQGETLLQTQVADNGETDKPNKKVHVVFEGLTDGVEYTVKYKGVGIETTITQEEINGEIDKLCVMNGYTFVSFVPIDTSQRPSNSDNIEKDVNGYISYDKENYCSNNSRQSFVIDNDTGYVYPIKDVTIQKIHNNLLLINNLVYDYNIVTDNLNFFPLFTNATIEVKDYMKDKHGNNYVFNDRIVSFDDTTKTYYLIYDSKKNYFLSPNNEIIFLVFSSMTLKKLDCNGNQVDFDINENYEFSFKGIDYDYEPWCLSRIERGYAYFYCLEAGQHGSTRFRLLDIVNNQWYERNLGLYNTTSGGWNKNCINATFIDDNHLIFYTDLVDGKGKLYTAEVWGDPNTVDKSEWISIWAYTDCMVPGTQSDL
ncbi:MAG: hypothetical protein IJX23_04505, partial [Clostridia bacterium]|nr:hypothetical protein [Clostridia bacterium]